MDRKDAAFPRTPSLRERIKAFFSEPKPKGLSEVIREETAEVPSRRPRRAYLKKSAGLRNGTTLPNTSRRSPPDSGTKKLGLVVPRGRRQARCRSGSVLYVCVKPSSSAARTRRRTPRCLAETAGSDSGRVGLCSARRRPRDLARRLRGRLKSHFL